MFSGWLCFYFFGGEKWTFHSCVWRRSDNDRKRLWVNKLFARISFNNFIHIVKILGKFDSHTCRESSRESQICNVDAKMKNKHDIRQIIQRECGFVTKNHLLFEFLAGSSLFSRHICDILIRPALFIACKYNTRQFDENLFEFSAPWKPFSLICIQKRVQWCYLFRCDDAGKMFFGKLKTPLFSLSCWHNLIFKFVSCVFFWATHIYLSYSYENTQKRHREAPPAAHDAPGPPLGRFDWYINKKI